MTTCKKQVQPQGSVIGSGERLFLSHAEEVCREGEDKDVDGPLFRPVKNNRTGTLDKHLDLG